VEGLYTVLATLPTHHAHLAGTKISLHQLHKVLGHVSQKAVRHAVSKGLVQGLELDSSSVEEFCNTCVKAKSAVPRARRSGYTGRGGGRYPLSVTLPSHLRMLRWLLMYRPRGSPDLPNLSFLPDLPNLSFLVARHQHHNPHLLHHEPPTNKRRHRHLEPQGCSHHQGTTRC
jgi:hypothetical protein